MPVTTIAGADIQVDDDGFMTEYDEWNEELAGELAKAIGIELTDAHMKVIEFLRGGCRGALAHRGQTDVKGEPVQQPCRRGLVLREALIDQDNTEDARVPFGDSIAFQGDGPRVHSSDEFGGQGGRCFVFEGRRKVDDEPCEQSVRREAGVGIVESYRWPSGGTTVVTRKSGQATLNGQGVRRDSIERAGMDFCLRSRQSGNTFCYRSN